jgi:hypothetical protein
MPRHARRVICDDDRRWLGARTMVGGGLLRCCGCLAQSSTALEHKTSDAVQRLFVLNAAVAKSSRRSMPELCIPWAFLQVFTCVCCVCNVGAFLTDLPWGRPRQLP